MFFSLIFLVSCVQKSDYQSSELNAVTIDTAQVCSTAVEKAKMELYEFCDEHGNYCRFWAGVDGHTLEEFHGRMVHAVENEDTIDPDAQCYVIDNSNRVSHTSESSFNAWQCSYCAVISRGTKKPSGGDFGGAGGCYVSYGGNHTWHEVSTIGGGWQCQGCGTTSYIDREPSGGDFGGWTGCTGGSPHRWTRF